MHLHHCLINRLKHPFCFHKHLIIPKSQDTNTLLRQKFSTNLIVIRLFKVLATVQFNDKLEFVAVKIEDVAAFRMLATEFQVKESMVAKQMPEQGFSICLAGAQFTGITADVVGQFGGWVGERWLCISPHSLTPNPSPACGRGGQVAFEAGDERLVHHVVDDFARCIEGAGLFAGGGAGLGVVGGEKVLEDLAEQLGVKRDFFLDGGVFGNGELVAVKNVNEPRDFGRLEFVVAISIAKIDDALIAEEQVVRHLERVVVAVGEAINTHVVRFFFGATSFVQALEKAAVHEGDASEELEYFIWILHQAAIAIEIVRHEILPGLAEHALIHFLIECGKEQVLQDGFVKSAFRGVVVAQ